MVRAKSELDLVFRILPKLTQDELQHITKRIEVLKGLSPTKRHRAAEPANAFHEAVYQVLAQKLFKLLNKRYPKTLRAFKEAIPKHGEQVEKALVIYEEQLLAWFPKESRLVRQAAGCYIANIVLGNLLDDGRDLHWAIIAAALCDAPNHFNRQFPGYIAQGFHQTVFIPMVTKYVRKESSKARRPSTRRGAEGAGDFSHPAR